ncbi:MAG: hypothetical protein K5776_01885 [Lachnospiraceae bacterium]|nr:hypothetical protein [Lachnospiraceae bacterium]
MQIESLRCQSCGGALKAVSSVCECEYCGVTNIICGETGNYIDLLNKANTLRENGFVATVGEYDHYERVMDELADVNPEMIYSMWAGYLANPPRQCSFCVTVL